MKAIHEAFGQWWDLLVEHPDTDGDELVSREAFRAVMQEQRSNCQNLWAGGVTRKGLRPG
ncbi:hypothetical protein ACF9IK_04765 [Kitasatospora hibisci]|uniref:hypothetical protein n=1 Tax=Kitasatospora hibisci TaxID=3369522 RepID=UPI00375470F0